MDAVILVYDVHDGKSFAEIKEVWLKEVRMYCKNNVRIFAIGNKCDVGGQGVKGNNRSYFEGEKIGCFDTSAKTGKGVS